MHVPHHGSIHDAPRGYRRFVSGSERSCQRWRRHVVTGMPEPQNKEGGTLDSQFGELLTPLQAAYHLGITTELLFAYTAGRARAKPCRLKTEDIGGKTRFKRTVLDEFDRYLGEPWVLEGEARTSVPRCIENHLRAESGNQCMRCGSGKGVDTAHIDPWDNSRSHHHHNLIRLCKSCHAEYDQHKSLTVEEVRKIKNLAIARTREALRNRMTLTAAQIRPPFPEGVLEGRTEEVEALRDALRSSRAILIHGPGGMGKTQLLAHTLRKVETGRRVVWVDVEQAASADAILTAMEVLLIDGVGPTTRATLPNRLDALSACVVLDGVEWASGPATEAVDDLLNELKNSTIHAQFVVTSQVDLQRTEFDERRELAGLAHEPSQKLFRLALRDDTQIDVDSERSLLSFADGHPLTLQLVGKLTGYLGSARTASALIKRRGAAAVQIQKRIKQDRKTSLNASLSLAYEELSEEEQRILYLIASCPGGILTRQLEFNEYGGSEVPLFLAALRSWSLVQTEAKGERYERSLMLSPIRSYVRQRWSEEHPVEAQAAIQMLVEDFAMMAVAVERKSGSATEVPTMLSMYSRDLPNLLFVVDEAEAHPKNPKLSSLALMICSALMRFFFVLRLPEQGSQLMKRGARIALRDEGEKRASKHIAMMVALAQRSQNMGVLADAEAMLEQISTEDVETRANIALTQAMLASCRDDYLAIEQHAREAITHFEAVRDELRDLYISEDEQGKLEDNNNDLSASFHKLGDGLLSQYRAAEALTAYEKALELLCGDAVAVNEGQILHQIGNCLSDMGDNTGAASVYARAAVRFHEVRMREYLSNALAGLGYALIEVDDEMSFPNTVSPEVLANGMDDVVEDVLKCFSAPFGLDQKAVNIATGKLFGVVVALSFSDVAQKLGPVAQALSSDTAHLRTDTAVGENVDQADRYAWEQLEALLTLMSSIAHFEAEVAERGHVREDDTMRLAISCAFQVMWAGRRVYPLDWLGVYLRKKWS